MNTWDAFCSSQDSSFPQKSLPFYDLGVIVDSHGLEEVFLKQWRRKKASFITVDDTKVKSSLFSDLVRAMFLFHDPEDPSSSGFLCRGCSVVLRRFANEFSFKCIFVLILSLSALVSGSSGCTLDSW
ncbi:hypothetical protein K1719_026944 [Acacia pycnantha]|nr:hypothetical protein K1719_026944 [Acacia pycnantha]